MYLDHPNILRYAKIRSMTPKVLNGASASVKLGLAGLSPGNREVKPGLRTMP
jgi:hypothetical protein